jgi:hypothetical protein
MGMLPDVREMISERKDLGILADDKVREAFIEECKEQERRDDIVKSNLEQIHLENQVKKMKKPRGWMGARDQFDLGD